MQKDIYLFLTKNTISDEDYPVSIMRQELSSERGKGLFLEEVSAKVEASLSGIMSAVPTQEATMRVLTMTAALNEFVAYLISETAGNQEARLKAMLDSLRVIWRAA